MHFPSLQMNVCACACVDVWLMTGARDPRCFIRGPKMSPPSCSACCCFSCTPPSTQPPTQPPQAPQIRVINLPISLPIYPDIHLLVHSSLHLSVFSKHPSIHPSSYRIYLLSSSSISSSRLFPISLHSSWQGRKRPQWSCNTYNHYLHSSLSSSSSSSASFGLISFCLHLLNHPLGHSVARGNWFFTFQQ